MKNNKQKWALETRFVSIGLGILMVIVWGVFVISRATEEDWTETSSYVVVLVVGTALALIPVLVLRVVKSWREVARVLMRDHVFFGAPDGDALIRYIYLGLLERLRRWRNGFGARRRS